MCRSANHERSSKHSMTYDGVRSFMNLSSGDPVSNEPELSVQVGISNRESVLLTQCITGYGSSLAAICSSEKAHKAFVKHSAAWHF